MRIVSTTIAAVTLLAAATPALAQDGAGAHGFPWGVVGVIGLIGLIPRFRRSS